MVRLPALSFSMPCNLPFRQVSQFSNFMGFEISPFSAKKVWHGNFL
jgi:hypothetical protein